jgi:putative transposase
VLNGAVLATCKSGHRHQEFLSFLREIDAVVGLLGELSLS